MATNTAQVNPPARHISEQQVVYLRKNVTFSTPGTIVVGSIPAGALIIKPMSGVQVATAFNAGTTNTLDIGTAASGAVFASASALGATAFVALSASTGVYRVAADTVITCTVTLSGTAATTGDADVVICYVENQ